MTECEPDKIGDFNALCDFFSEVSKEYNNALQNVRDLIDELLEKMAEDCVAEIAKEPIKHVAVETLKSCVNDFCAENFVPKLPKINEDITTWFESFKGITDEYHSSLLFETEGKFFSVNGELQKLFETDGKELNFNVTIWNLIYGQILGVIDAWILRVEESLKACESLVTEDNFRIISTYIRKQKHFLLEGICIDGSFFIFQCFPYECKEFDAVPVGEFTVTLAATIAERVRNTFQNNVYAQLDAFLS